MAGFIAKQLVSKPLDAVKNVAKDAGGLSQTNEQDFEASLNAAEEKRRERFEDMEEQRENLRQTIRDKYGLKKKPDYLEVNTPNVSRRSSSHRGSDINLNIPRRTNQDDSLTKYLPTVVQDVASRAINLPQQLAEQASDKCSAM